MEAAFRFSRRPEPTSMSAVHGCGESLPDPQIPGIFLQHALRMKLKAHDKSRLGIVISLDQSIIGLRHRLKARGQFANSLMMIAIYSQRFPAIPARERGFRNDREGMAVRIVIVIVDVRAMRAFFLLHVSVKRPAANHVQ